MVQVYNEVENGNLERCLSSLSKYCDKIVVYDDASTDSPHAIYDKYDCYVIQGSVNNFRNELESKQVVLDRCINFIGADWILRMDADEVVEVAGEKEIRNLCEYPTNYTSCAFHITNLWRSEKFYRLDSSYNDVVFNRLWKVPQNKVLRFDVKPGLHQTNYPIGATDNEAMATFEILHYGFASDKAILDKYKMYKSHGQTGWALDRLIDERGIRVGESKQEWFNHPLPDVSLNQVFAKPIRSLVNG